VRETLPRGLASEIWFGGDVMSIARGAGCGRGRVAGGRGRRRQPTG
jgi:hypothetical protein